MEKKSSKNKYILLGIIFIIIGVILLLTGQENKSDVIEAARDNINDIYDNASSDADYQYFNLLSELKKKNGDFYGWLKIPETIMNYPVVYTPDDPQKYLRKNFDGEYSIPGTLFIDANTDPDTPSKNIIIYGHNIHTGTMFHDLLKYTEEGYYKEHKTIYLYTLSGIREYEIIAAYRTTTSDDVYLFINPENKEEYDIFISKCKEKTPYKTSDVDYENLITLSTCSHHARNGRYVVIGKECDK